MDVTLPKFCTKWKGLAFIMVLCLVAGCAADPKPSNEVLGSPANHISNGFKFLKKGYTLDAQREFDLALQLDPYNSPAHRGLALIYSREKQFEKAFTAIQKAVDNASSGEQKALAYVGFMRIYMEQKSPDWFASVHKCFEEAVKWQNDLPEPYFHMGLAYKEVHQYEKAKEAFKRVISMKKSLVREARRELSSLPNTVD